MGTVSHALGPTEPLVVALLYSMSWHVRKKFSKKNHISYSNTPTITKFDTDFKTGLKKLHEISEGYDFVIKISGE